ncbi:MAG: DMT family transporter [Chloroflexi bacterium]|nr:DMT family transporter [Chloroflexota bacterium]
MRLAWSTYYVVGRDLVRRHPPIAVLTVVNVVGAIGLTPFGIGDRLFGAPATWTLPGLLVVLYTGVLVNAVGFFGHAWALTRADAARIAAFMYLQPLLGILFSALILGERPSPPLLAGGTLILGGVTLVISGERGRPVPQPTR